MIGYALILFNDLILSSLLLPDGIELNQKTVHGVGEVALEAKMEKIVVFRNV